MARDPLAKALADLTREIERAPDPAQPKPLTVVTTPHRDDEHRLVYTDIVRSDGKRWRKTPMRDEQHRVVSTITEELTDGGAS